ncbi:MAG: plastocyanin/azurin family copper-binding protein [Ilumatobacteraceae bacterium]
MLATVAVAVSLAACGADGDDSLRAIAAGGADSGAITVPVVPDTAAYPASGEVVEVLSIDNVFLPEVIEIAAGTEVVWLNNGRNDHDVTPDGDVRRLEWGVDADGFPPTASYSHKFSRPGTYVYFCSIHGTAVAGMVGTVVVTPP